MVDQHEVKNGHSNVQMELRKKQKKHTHAVDLHDGWQHSHRIRSINVISERLT